MKNSIFAIVAVLITLLTFPSCSKECFDCQTHGGGTATGSAYIVGAKALTTAKLDRMAIGSTCWVLLAQPTACQKSYNDEPCILTRIQIVQNPQNPNWHSYVELDETMVAYIAWDADVLKTQISGYFSLDSYDAVIVDLY